MAPIATEPPRQGNERPARGIPSGGVAPQSNISKFSLDAPRPPGAVLGLMQEMTVTGD